MQIKKVLKEILVLFLIILGISTLFRIYKISDISMNYTLVEGDFVVVDNFSIGIHFPSFPLFFWDKHIWSNEKNIKRGDILVFRYKLDPRLYIKRCVALPGDLIFQKEKNLFLQIQANSKKTLKFAKELNLKLVRIKNSWWIKNPYKKFYSVVHDERVIGPKELINIPIQKIPPHSYFFMGDFRDNSTDSRFFGPIEYDYIYYKVRFIFKKSRNINTLGKIRNLKS
jgi:signal peptidase I